MTHRRSVFAIPAVFLAVLAAAAPAHALQVWSGRTYLFVRPDGANWNLPENQDRITSNVWITRKNSMGIFNIKQEAGYGPGSPADTRWATGNAVDHASLTFQPWVTWAMSNPPATVGVDAVVHLISDDIYIDIRFESWTPGGILGGFSYRRGEPPATSVTDGAAAFSLRGFLANPVRGDARVAFSLPDAAPARIDVLDLAGRLVASRDVGSLGAGAHQIELPELRAAPPGLVFVRLVRDGRSLVARGTWLR